MASAFTGGWPATSQAPALTLPLAGIDFAPPATNSEDSVPDTPRSDSGTWSAEAWEELLRRHEHPESAREALQEGQEEAGPSEDSEVMRSQSESASPGRTLAARLRNDLSVLVEVERRMWLATRAEIERAKGDDEAALCVICLDRMELSSAVRMECGHCIHIDCAVKSERHAMQLHGYFACPHCRRTVSFLRGKMISGRREISTFNTCPEKGIVARLSANQIKSNSLLSGILAFALDVNKDDFALGERDGSVSVEPAAADSLKYSSAQDNSLRGTARVVRLEVSELSREWATGSRRLFHERTARLQQQNATAISSLLSHLREGRQHYGIDIYDLSGPQDHQEGDGEERGSERQRSVCQKLKRSRCMCLAISFFSVVLFVILVSLVYLSNLFWDNLLKS